MRNSPVVLALVLATLILPSTAPAQYIYLDANGDGIHTSADVLATTGSTTVDVWLHTDQNLDGAPALCPSQDGPFTINGYELILHSTDGTVEWSGFTNRVSQFSGSQGEVSSGTDYHNGFGGGSLLPAGLYRLASITITPASGFTDIQFASSTPLSGAFTTSFGSNCSGTEFDNTLKLGSDWLDADGLAWGGPRIHPPVWVQPLAMALLEGRSADQGITATDLDGDPVAFSKAAGPGFMTVSTLDAGTGTATGNIHLAPGPNDAGHYTGRVRAFDGHYSVDATFAIDVAARSLILVPIPPIVMTQHRDSLITLSVTGSDAEQILYKREAGPDYAHVFNATDRTAFLLLQPNFRSHVGTAVAVISAHDEVAADTQSVAITVLPNFAPPQVSVSEGNYIQVHTSSEVYVYSYDPDGDDISSLTFDDSALPPSDVTSFTPQYYGQYAYGTLSWTPSQMGTFTLRFTVTDAFGSSATGALEVQVHSRQVILSAPEFVGAMPLRPVSIDVSVSDPDGDPIQSLTADLGSALQSGATFTKNFENTAGTVDWTPRTQDAAVNGVRHFGMYFQASDGDLTSYAPATVGVTFSSLSRLDANNLDLLVGNGGQTGFEFIQTEPGLAYPKGSQNTVLFALGPWIGGKAGDALRVSRGGSQTEFFPGTTRGTVPNPFDVRFRNFRISRGDVTSEDYLQWPAADGAPVDAGGQPRMDGDQFVWSVSNDTEAGRRIAGPEYKAGTLPMGVEVRQSTFSFAAPGPLADMAFVRFVLTNRGLSDIDSAYATVWADVDVGQPSDDAAGCDPSLDLGYVYNADAMDSQYGGAAPALGLVLLESPTTPGTPDTGTPRMNSFTSYDIAMVNLERLSPERSFVLMQGKNPDGSAMHRAGDPAQPVTTFRYDGDPVAGTGWLDLVPADKRIMVSSGPFHLGAEETKEFVTAILVGQGSDRLASVGALRELVPVVRYVAASNYALLPYVKAPREVTVAEGALLNLSIQALDLDGDPLTSLTADLSGLPLGNDAAFTAGPGSSSGSLTWTPNLSHAGAYIVRFTASNDKSGTFETSIRVLQTNRAPVADAGGPYTGLAGFPLELNAAGSSDADGDSLSYAWRFGDGATGLGAMIHHTYAAGGTYPVVLTVRDAALADSDSTTATIGATVAARAFAAGLEGIIRLASWRPFHCFQLEPVGGSFAITDLDARSIRLVSIGTGSISEVPAFGAKAILAMDRDHNSIPEATLCFSTFGLRRLFDNLPPGKQTVVAAITGALVSGARFQAPITFQVVVPFALSASLAPNPMNPDATLTFVITKPGRVRVRLLDVQGRLVQTIHDAPLDAGYHDLRIGSADGSGRRLASGIYFYSIEAPEGSERGRVVVLK